MQVKALRWVVLAALCSAIVASAGVVLTQAWRTLGAPMNIAAAGEWLTVAPGTSLNRVSGELARRGILDSSWALNAYARYSGAATQIHAGEYLVSRGTSARELLDQLVAGRVYLHDLTIVEGWNFDNVVNALRRHPAVDASGLNPDTLMAELGKAELHPEGQFYPDTYRFARDTSAMAILKQANEAMQDRLEQAWGQYRTTTVLESAYDALILASIIEKETALSEERRRISGVFHRRLERGMRLQADPTVIYGLGENFDGKLGREELAGDTPYNTYTRSGLPPTPIAMPGQQSLSAAVDPAPGTELYFVATALGDGSHSFSSTLDEHNEAVARYRSGTPPAETGAR